MNIIITFFSVITLVTHAWARELTDLSLKVEAATKQEAFDKAIEDATLQLTEELLGAEKAAKAWSAARPKLLKNSTRYVVFIKSTATAAAGDGQNRYQVQLRLSPDSLEALLREVGAVGSTTVRLLSLVAVTDSAGGRYIWWTDMSDDKKTSLSEDLFKKFFQQLQGGFKGKNVFVLDPTKASFRMSVPANSRIESMRREDQMMLAQYLNADVVLSGRIDVIRGAGGGPQLSHDLELWQAKSGRSLNESQGSVPLSSDSPKVLLHTMDQSSASVLAEMGQKLHQALASGSLNLNVVSVAVEGSLGFKQLNEFRRQLQSVREIKILRERLFEPSRVTFEAESSVSGKELGSRLAKINFPAFRVDVDSAQDNILVLSVKALSSASAH